MKNPTLIGTAAACLMAAAFAAPAWSAPSDGMKSVSQLQPDCRTDVPGPPPTVLHLIPLVPARRAAASTRTGRPTGPALPSGARRHELLS